MKISEIFYSLQGEGFLAGVPSIFIRMAGCPLKCNWCDTKYAWDKESGQEFGVEQIISRIEQWLCKNAVITGGEPIIDSDLSRLTHSLKKSGKHITIETSGIEFVSGLECDFMSISPKLSNAGQNNAVNIEALNRFIAEYNYQLKFVAENEKDLLEIESVLSKLENIDRNKVCIMPQAACRQQYLEKAPFIAELCIKNGFSFSPRLHILLWDNQRGR